MAIQHSYREINKFLNWEPNEDGFNKATSHMLRKFFNTQLINAGMAEEIREHMMGHKLKDRFRDAHFLADPYDLRKSYLRYIDYLNVIAFNYFIQFPGVVQFGVHFSQFPGGSHQGYGLDYYFLINFHILLQSYGISTVQDMSFKFFRNLFLLIGTHAFCYFVYIIIIIISYSPIL
jgi:hypothetical protein